jgi:hypothetical protein
MARSEKNTDLSVEASLTTEGAQYQAPPPEEPPVYETESVRYTRVKSDKRKKKKRRTSAGLGDAERFGHHATRASSRLARAVSKGFRRYERERDRSARNRRDGALRDFIENASLGLGATLRAAADVPYELARGTNSRGVRRQTRCFAGVLAVPFLR